MTLKMKLTLNSIATILFISNFSFAQMTSLDLAAVFPAKTDSSHGLSMVKNDVKPNVDNAAKQSDLVVIESNKHLAQNGNYTDLMFTNGVEGKVLLEIRVSSIGEAKPSIVKRFLEKLDNSILAAINQMESFDFSENGY